MLCFGVGFQGINYFGFFKFQECFFYSFFGVKELSLNSLVIFVLYFLHFLYIFFS